jgi:hypothetical protein
MLFYNCHISKDSMKQIRVYKEKVIGIWYQRDHALTQPHSPFVPPQEGKKNNLKTMSFSADPLCRINASPMENEMNDSLRWQNSSQPYKCTTALSSCSSRDKSFQYSRLHRHTVFHNLFSSKKEKTKGCLAQLSSETILKLLISWNGSLDASGVLFYSF